MLVVVVGRTRHELDRVEVAPRRMRSRPGPRLGIECREDRDGLVTTTRESCQQLVERRTGLALPGRRLDPRPGRLLRGLELAAPIMGAEDFSYVLQQVPGAMAFVGARPDGQDPATAPQNHSNLVVFDEPAMAVGVALYAAVAIRHLGGEAPS